MLDKDGNQITYIGMPLEDLVSCVFLTKTDLHENVKRARLVELINKFDNNLELDPTRCQFKIAIKEYAKQYDNGFNNSKFDTGFNSIISYNDILDYVERETNNKVGDNWKFLKVHNNSLISGKKRADDKIEVQML